MATTSNELDIRPARPDDYPHYARLFLELGVPEPPHEESIWRDALMARTVFLDLGGQPAAYAYFDLLPQCGYVRNIVVAPEHRRKGLGRTLMRAMAEDFVARGCTEWRLNVKDDNIAALALYQACGMASEYRTTSLSLAHDRIAQLPEPPAWVRVRPLAPERDHEAEARFRMPVGQMSSLRGRPGAELYELVDESRSPARCVGVTRFTPSMPGAFPFRVDSPELLRPFIAFLAARIAPDTRPLMLTCEAEPESVRALIAAGATVLMEILHMRGALPLP